MNEDFDGIANMTNKEAAFVLSRLKMTIQLGRRNGKTMYFLSVNRAMQKAIEALEENAKKEEETDNAKREFLEYVSANTICGFSFDDLKQLALALRETGINPEELKDANKMFQRGAAYVVEELSKKKQLAAIEDAILNGDRSNDDKRLSDIKKAAHRWNEKEKKTGKP